MTDKPPVIEDAPGLVWKKRLVGWEARWYCRSDLVKRGYEPKSCRLWKGEELNNFDIEFIRTRCRALQDDMLFFSRGGRDVIVEFDDTVRGLIRCYQTDKDSPYKKLEYKTREGYGTLCRRITVVCGELPLEAIKARDLLAFHKVWSGDGKHISMGHSCVGMFRTLVNFGATILESKECERLSFVLSKMKFKMGKARDQAITAEQAQQVIAEAHRKGLHSIALAQAFQFECILRQKDVIGEWLPLSEPLLSDVTSGNNKWVKGLRWEEIDAEMVLHHVTSKRKKKVEPNLRDLQMVMDEFSRLGALPPKGPIIVSELTGIPWTAVEFRRQWRIIAKACGIPDEVRNMDSRAGAITEALLAGAPMDSVRKSATHSNASMTQRYSRGDQDASAEVARYRNIARTSGPKTKGE